MLAKKYTERLKFNSRWSKEHRWEEPRYFGRKLWSKYHFNDRPYYEISQTKNDIRIWCSRNDDVATLISGYFTLIEPHLINPINNWQYSAMDASEIEISLSGVFHRDEDKIKQFTDYLDAHGVKWW